MADSIVTEILSFLNSAQSLGNFLIVQNHPKRPTEVVMSIEKTGFSGVSKEVKEFWEHDQSMRQRSIGLYTPIDVSLVLWFQMQGSFSDEHT